MSVSAILMTAQRELWSSYTRLQAVMNHSHALSSNAFTVSREEYSRGPNRLSHLSKPRKKGPMRPSMELRHRQLDLSLLQVPRLRPPALSLLLSWCQCVSLALPSAETAAY